MVRLVSVAWKVPRERALSGSGRQSLVSVAPETIIGRELSRVVRRKILLSHHGQVELRHSGEFQSCLDIDVRGRRVSGQQLDGVVASASGVDQNAPRQVMKRGFPCGLRRADTKPADLIVMADTGWA